MTETLKPSAARGLAQTLRSYAGSPCLSLDLSLALDCAAEVIEGGDPTPEALEAWAEWFKEHGPTVLEGIVFDVDIPILLREIARRLRAAREE